MENKISPTVSTLAYAKLNLMLRITGRRDDGFHFLDMLNVSVDLADELSLTLLHQTSPSLVVVRDELSDPQNPKNFISTSLLHEMQSVDVNLAARAVKATLSELSISSGFRIEIRKRIPIGAGMGGGSSDAAAAIKLTLQATQKSLPTETLHRIGLSLGADVPYFLHNGPARVRGVGEIIERIDLSYLADYEAAIFTPPFGINTAQVYAQFRKDNRELTVKPLEVPLQLGLNDLESSASKINGIVGRLVADIRYACQPSESVFAGMTGSGAVCYALYPRGQRPKLVEKFIGIQNKYDAAIKFCGLRLQHD